MPEDDAGEVEEPLYGGLEGGRVIRIGRTVRRPAGAWTASVHSLLEHVRAKGFPAPAALGIDDQGRERLEFIEGEAGLRPWPAILLRVAGVMQIGRLLRAYHEAVADFRPARSRWRDGSGSPTPGQIVLHGDFAPYNVIWKGAQIVGVIDWELARPGAAIEDVAFAAFQCVPLRPDAAAKEAGFSAPPDRATRLAAFSEAYGRHGPRTIAQAAVRVLAEDLVRMERLGGAGEEPWAGFLRRGLRERTRAEAAWLRQWLERAKS